MEGSTTIKLKKSQVKPPAEIWHSGTQRHKGSSSMTRLKPWLLIKELHSRKTSDRLHDGPGRSAMPMIRHHPPPDPCSIGATGSQTCRHLCCSRTPQPCISRHYPTAGAENAGIQTLMTILSGRNPGCQGKNIIIHTHDSASEWSSATKRNKTTSPPNALYCQIFLTQGRKPIHCE